jgi:rRNA maturation endonuclease Nob1
MTSAGVATAIARMTKANLRKAEAERRRKKYRKRCRYCHRLFLTNQPAAKFCPGTNHRWLRWEELHPRMTRMEKRRGGARPWRKR